LVLGADGISDKRVDTSISLCIAETVVDGVLVLSSPLSAIGGVLFGPGFGVKRAVLTLRFNITVGHLGSQKVCVEKLADLCRSTVLRGCGDVVVGLGFTVSSALTDVPEAGEYLGPHESVISLGIVRCVDRVLAVVESSVVAGGSSDLGGHISVGTSNGDFELSARLSNIDRVGISRLPAPVNALWTVSIVLLKKWKTSFTLIMVTEDGSGHDCGLGSTSKN
jgi:hypothetical protein